MNQSNSISTQASGATSALPSFSELIASGVIYRHITALLALAGVITLGVGLILWASRPDYVPIYDRLSSADTQKIAETLRAAGIPYQIESGSGLVLTPADQLQQARMKLAAAGLTARDGVGIEMLQQDQGLGTSQFVENARYHHALETELARTIGNMRNIEAARIHLAIPKQSVFIRDRAQPSASVMVKLLPGRALASGQVAAIVQLVASSIPGMESSHVTVVDQWGKLLSSGDGETGIDLAAKQFEYNRKLEQTYAAKIEQLLTPIVGAGRVRAQVSADIDFSQQESTQEQYEPGDGQIRSEQTEEQRSTGAIAAVGIPGALSNQPPPAGSTDKKKSQKDPKGDTPQNISTESVRNYELDKKIVHSRHATGKLKRLSVAVLVDNKVTTNEAGEQVSEPLSEEELKTLTDIVKEAVGYDESRGDRVAVFNKSFQPMEEIEPAPGPAFYEQPWVWSMAKQVLVGVALLLLVIFVARPAMKNLKPPKPAEDADQAAAPAGGELAPDQVYLSQAGQNAPVANGANGSAPALAPPQAYGDVLNLARGLAHEDPKRVAKVIKTWVEENV